MTVYIVTPFRPDAIMEDELSIENTAVDCPDLTKLDSVPTFVPEYKVLTLYSDRTPAPCPNSSVGT